MAKIGFARVSTQEQDLTEQIVQLEKVGCTKIFSGKNSGTIKNNQERIDELLNYLREDDILMVTKLDRLGRSLKQVLTVLDYLRENNIGFKTLDGAIDTTKKDDPFARAMIQLLGMFSELERNFIVIRTQEGKKAKGKNAIGGRPKKMNKEKLCNFKKDISKGLSITQLSEKYNISVSTVQRYKKNL